MKRVIVVLAAVCVAFAALAAVQRELTPEEEAAIAPYIAAREAAQTSKFAVPSSTEEGIQLNLKTYRRPGDLCREYERCKINIPNWKPGDPGQRWLQRPKFPGWDDGCYTWYPDGKYYTRQLYCSKCNKWVNPNGYTCSLNHPLPLMDQWRFTVRLIATDHKKPMEAKAHVWNAHQHGELTDAQYDELMGIIDAIEAEAKAKTEGAAKAP
jgi:hypothetical protein